MLLNLLPAAATVVKRAVSAATLVSAPVPIVTAPVVAVMLTDVVPAAQLSTSAAVPVAMLPAPAARQATVHAVHAHVTQHVAHHQQLRLQNLPRAVAPPVIAASNMDS